MCMIKDLYPEYLRNYKSIIKTNNPVKKWTKDLSGYFTKIYEWPNEHMKRWPVSLVIREMQIKITKRDCFIPTRMAKEE